jgi:hypothetical protein
MTEAEYIRVANLTRVRILQETLKGLHTDEEYGISKTDYQEADTIIDRWREILERLVK